jgi:hypothetical protein
MKKALNLLLALAFALFAAWQYNDPDPWVWASLYGFVAAVCGYALFKTLHPGVLLAGMLVCLLWGASLLPEFIGWLRMGAPSITGSMKAEAPHVEFTREFLGLLICLAALAWQYRQVSVGNAGKQAQ